MTKEEIIKKGFEAYPEEIVGYSVEERVGAKPKPLDYNKDKREGYIKALTEIESLPKIKGWVARDRLSGHIYIHQTKPKENKMLGIWEEPGGYSIQVSSSVIDFPDITIDSEPVEVELLIRRIVTWQR